MPPTIAMIATLLPPSSGFESVAAAFVSVAVFASTAGVGVAFVWGWTPDPPFPPVFVRGGVFVVPPFVGLVGVVGGVVGGVVTGGSPAFGSRTPGPTVPGSTTGGRVLGVVMTQCGRIGGQLGIAPAAGAVAAVPSMAADRLPMAAMPRTAAERTSFPVRCFEWMVIGLSLRSYDPSVGRSMSERRRRADLTLFSWIA
jgi:hypothetical protein